jgi:hypothetical protein
MKQMGTAEWNRLTYEEKEGAKAEYNANPERRARQDDRRAAKKAADVAVLERMGEDSTQVSANSGLM